MFTPACFFAAGHPTCFEFLGEILSIVTGSDQKKGDQQERRKALVHHQ
jgi:hypothetical protein